MVVNKYKFCLMRKWLWICLFIINSFLASGVGVQELDRIPLSINVEGSDPLKFSVYLIEGSNDMVYSWVSNNPAGLFVNILKDIKNPVIEESFLKKIEDPLLVSNEMGLSDAAYLSTNDLGEVLIFWKSADNKVHGNILKTDGNFLRPIEDPIEISLEGGNFGFSLVPDNKGGAIIAWRAAKGQKLYASIIKRDGSSIDPVLVSDYTGITPRVVTNDQNGAIIFWIDHEFVNSNILSEDGNLLKPKDKPLVVGELSKDFVLPKSFPSAFPQVLTDGNGGAFIAWANFIFSASETDVMSITKETYANIIDQSGNLLFPSDNPILVAEATETSDFSRGIVRGEKNGGISVVWLMKELGLFINTVSGDGATSNPFQFYDFLEAGHVPEEISSIMVIPKLVSDEEGRIIFAYASSSNVYLNKLYDLTSLRKEGPIILNKGELYNFDLVSDGEEGAIFIYYDKQNKKLFGKFLDKDLNIKVFKFIRGDSNGDWVVDLSDIIFTLNYLFKGGVALSCIDAADVNDDGRIDITDAIYLLGHLFQGKAAPPMPYPDAGIDPTIDGLDCNS